MQTNRELIERAHQLLFHAELAGELPEYLALTLYAVLELLGDGEYAADYLGMAETCARAWQVGHRRVSSCKTR